MMKSTLMLKVGVNHGIFHVYHFWNFLIFKYTWVCSSSSSKNKNIFLNLSINSINSKMSIYLSISKMCSSLFSRGNQACARIANTKRTTQSRDAALSANVKRDALDIWTGSFTLATSSLLWKQQWNSWHLLRNNEHIFPDFMDITVWILRKLAQKNDALFCPQCVQMTGIFVFPRGCRGHFYCCLRPVLNKNIVFYEFILRQ